MAQTIIEGQALAVICSNKCTKCSSYTIWVILSSIS